MKRIITSSALLVILNLVCALSLQSQESIEPFAPSIPVLFRPYFSFGVGELRYGERNSKLDPGLKSHFEEAVFESGLGMEFIFEGHHSLMVDFDFIQTSTDTERWRDFGALVQENDLDISRFSLEIGYRISTWNRARIPQLLPDLDRIVRFDGGFSVYYRRQRFRRDEFIDFEQVPPQFNDVEVEETFDMLGAEVTMGLELGPRHLAAFFVRGRVGGGYVSVLNDGFEPAIDKEDAEIESASVQGMIEAGVVSQFTPSIELRLGYRFFQQEVFEEMITVNTPTQNIAIELPDNTTEMHIVFFEAAFPF